MQQKHRILSTAAVLLGIAALVWGVPAEAIARQTSESERSFQFSPRGGVALGSSGTASGDAAVSYARVRATGGSSMPPGFGIFGRRDANGVRITETSVPAASLIRRGRTHAAFSPDQIDTAIAIVNPNDQTATIEFFFTNSNREDADFGHGSFMLAPHEQTARFLSEPPFSFEPGVRATFTFSSSLPVAAIALTQLTNAQSEVLYNTLPVVDLDRTFSSDTVFIPHLATGGGWSTDFILINPTDEPLEGQLIFVSRGVLNDENPDWDIPAQSTEVSVNNGFSPVYQYAIGARGLAFFRTTLPLPFVQTYSAQVRPLEDGGPTPVVQVVLTSLSATGDPLSEAAFPAGEPGTAFRLYVETQGDPAGPGSIRSGFAIRNVEFERATIAAELSDLAGNLLATTEVAVPASGQRSYFIDEIFPGFAFGGSFRGVLRLSTEDQRFALVSLRTRRNELDRFQITTTPPSDEADPTSTADVFFPHLVNGGGWTTEAVFFSGTAAQSGAGVLEFFGADGEPVDVPLQ